MCDKYGHIYAESFVNLIVCFLTCLHVSLDSSLHVKFIACYVFLGFFTQLGSQRMPRRPRHRNVAQEVGPEGLDPEYMFSPRARSVASEMPNDASLYESDDGRFNCDQSLG